MLPSAAGQTISNTAKVSYNAQTLGTGYSQEATSSASVTVVGFTLAGQVYHDLQAQRPEVLWGELERRGHGLGEAPPGGSVVAQAQVDPGSGVFSFTGVAPGSYTLFLDNNNDPSDTTPTPLRAGSSSTPLG